jgi:hypothetical protein
MSFSYQVYDGSSDLAVRYIPLLDDNIWKIISDE